jgi:hypothetical protein
MKSTNNTQTNEDMNKKAIAPTWQSCIVEELSDEAQAAVNGGLTWVSAETHATSPEQSLKSYYANPGAFIG